MILYVQLINRRVEWRWHKQQGIQNCIASSSSNVAVLLLPLSSSSSCLVSVVVVNAVHIYIPNPTANLWNIIHSYGFLVNVPFGKC